MLFVIIKILLDTLDSKNTEIAINKFNDFINRFPSSERVEESDKLINELREKLAKTI